MKRIKRILIAVNLLIAMNCYGEMKSDFRSLPDGLKKVAFTETTASFVKKANTFSWISDVEHVVNPKNGDVYLADAKEPYYICGDIVPGGVYFELFPYHYYDQKEVDELGSEINYKLIAKNITDKPVVLEIEGQGTVRDWDHYKTWEGALSGNDKRVITIKPGETVELWKEESLKGDLPWSGIFLGYSSGDLWVCDYAYLSKDDPGIDGAKQMPDISQPPCNWPSFTRGVADFNYADIKMFKNKLTAASRIDLGKIESGIYSFAIADSPGGPQNNPSDYAVIKGTFADDELPVMDPVSKKSHSFFGGNYPIMYDVDLSFANTTEREVNVSLLVSSNDKFNVDTIVGLWKDSKMQWRRVPMISKNQHWAVFEIAVKPGQIVDDSVMLIPLGSRWGGMVCSLVVK